MEVIALTEKSIKKNYIYNVLYQLLTIITPLITTPHVSRKLGAEEIGIYSFTASIVAYFTMAAAMGTARYGQREISYSQNDIERRSLYFWKIEVLSCISTIVCTIFYIGYILINKEYVDIYFVQIFSIVAIAADVSWFFQGMEEFGRIIKRNVSFKIVNIVYIFCVVKSREDLILYVGGLSVITLISNLSLWPFLEGIIKRPTWASIKFYTILPDVIALFIPTIAISVYTVLDKTMIGVITNSAFENGYYEQSLKISRAVMTIVTSLGVVMVPRIGHYFIEKKMDIVKQYMYKSYRFVWLIGIPLCFGLCAIAPNLVPWFFGVGYDRVVPILSISSFLILAVGINNVTGIQYLIPTKRQNQFTLTVVLGAVVNFALNYVLIKKYQSIGAAVASVVAESVIAISQLILVRHEISGIEVVKSSIKYLLSGVAMFIGVWSVEKLLSPSIVNTVILIVAGGAIYIVMLYLLRDTFFVSQVNSMLSVLKKKIVREG